MQKYRFAHHPLSARPRAGLGSTERHHGCVFTACERKGCRISISHTAGSVEARATPAFLQHINNGDHLRQKQREKKKKRSRFCLIYLCELKVNHTSPRSGCYEPASFQSELQPVRWRKIEKIVSFLALAQPWKRPLLLTNPFRKWPKKILSCWTWWWVNTEHFV